MSESVTRTVQPGRPALVAVAAVTGILFAGTVALWAHYGTSVFYEMILSGFNACF